MIQRRSKLRVEEVPGTGWAVASPGGGEPYFCGQSSLGMSS